MVPMNPADAPDLPAALGHFLETRMTNVRGRLVLGYSGGMDSTVLLALLVQLRQPSWPPLLAVHVHHGLQPEADAWVSHCQRQTQQWQVDLQVHRVQVPSAPSLEAQARSMRRGVFAAVLQAEDVLLLAHHADDQVETLLFRLVRGTGIDGWAGMMPSGQWQEGETAVDCWRPLLSWRKNQLLAWARQQSLHWIEDPSNTDTQLDRNYLRQVIWPALERRWPQAAAHVLALSTEVQEVKDWLLQEEQHWRGQVLQGRRLYDPPLRLAPVVLQRRLIRTWLHSLQAPVPERRLVEELLAAGAHALPRRWQWRGFEVFFYQQYYYGRFLAPAVNRTPIPWVPEVPLLLPDGRLLQARYSQGKGGLRSTEGVTIAYRQGGERLQLYAHGPHHSLKKLFQSWKIPQFWRNDWPMLFCGTQLVAVPGYAVEAEFQSGEGEWGWYFSEELEVA